MGVEAAREMSSQVSVGLQMLAQGGQRWLHVLGHVAAKRIAGHGRKTRPRGSVKRVWASDSYEAGCRTVGGVEGL